MKLISIITTFILLPSTLLQEAIISAATGYDHHYLLNCGASSTDVNRPSTWDGLRWDSDDNKTFSTSFSSTTIVSAKSTVNIADIPFSSARIFTSNFTYSFPVSPGPKFIRLFFYPSEYSSSSSSFSGTDAYLTVVSNSGHLLLRNFSAYLSLTNSTKFVQKEFYVNVNSSLLQLTFSPTPPSSSYAFINGIEVVSVPENLYVGRPTTPKNVENMDITFDLVKSTALETAYRLNVGGSEIGRKEDSGVMYRYWESNDESYLTGPSEGRTGGLNSEANIKYTLKTPNYSAPIGVYQSFRAWNGINNVATKGNMTWEFEVDLGFLYLVRLHWCEVVVDVNASNDRVFNVYIDQLTADEGVDVYERVGSNTALFVDYVIYMDEGNPSDTRGFLQLTMHPDVESNPGYLDVLLNGLEIFKINKADGSLDAPNPKSTPIDTPIIDPRPSPPSSHSHILPLIIGIMIGIFILSIFLYYIFIKIHGWSKILAGSSGTHSSSSKLKWLIGFGKSGTNKRSDEESSSLPSDQHCRHFSLEEIRLATSDFSKSNIVGAGGFGNVYKGTIETESGPTIVAIKRRNPLSKQGPREFKMEIELLSKLHHVNLVSLIGYCDAAGEMILVYEYMPHGTLRDHIFLQNLDPNARLSWHRRLEICLGAARGLHYLHTHTHGMIIHRDVKSTNILLDETLVAKVSDLGYSKFGPTEDNLVSHVSTAVKGSFGYVDPEYYRSRQLTEKSDVYSFGVVLFEVLCGRAAMNLDLPKEQVNLRIWARRNLVNGTLDTIVDPALKGQIAPECLRKYGELAESCVRDKGTNRPSMADVICGLQFVLQLQPEASTPKLLSLYKRSSN